ncbi:indolepyruvate ferredoxin oxidoreductase [Corynebacterium sp. HMSC08A12]|uniref:DUF6537 domain-containing protein n=1 Tax=Corynebacterium sp. HMSC08A12 TaxID=1581134 RepID=UPI0008A4D013|nr:DUF6537 domain-containing protein [Corynebacterium sp. HMSC08A12]OFT36042.1 indolepyruvate ferredoxin oxidoreductase [Corynebacterium sp. HMSC08A12]
MTSTFIPDSISPVQDLPDYTQSRYREKTGHIHLTGIQALVRTVLDRAEADREIGLQTSSFVSGYEGSPLGGYDLELGRRKSLLGQFDVQHFPAVNEELGVTAVAGSQMTDRATVKDGIDGVVGYWYGKAPGLDRAADALRHANMTGTSGTGGAVAFVGDDPTAKSSTIPSASGRILADLGLPTLVPADAGDVLRLGTHAAWMSRYSGLWTALRITTPVADGSASVDLEAIREATTARGLERGGEHVPEARLLGKRLLDLEDTRVGERLQRALEYAREHRLNRWWGARDGDRVGVICAGNTSLEVAEVVGEANVRVLQLAMTYPLDPQELESFCEGLDTLVVAEELGTHLLESVRACLYDLPVRPAIEHVNDPLKQLPKLLRNEGIEVAGVTSGPTRISLPLAVPNRVPHFCSGCPHNLSTRADEDTLVGAGIGCHAMVMLMDDKRVGKIMGTAQMGGEGAHWIGMHSFVSEEHFVQNMGDGTFLHSGSLALRAMVASKVNATLKLLHNGTVAMTGGQDPVGQPSLAGLVDMVRAENPARIVVTSDDVRRTRRALRGSGVQVRPREDLAKVQKELEVLQGVSVLIHDQECAAEKRRARNRNQRAQATEKIVINERICEGCGDCGEKSGCLSLQPVDTQFGRKTRVDQTSCNTDRSCLSGDCPAFTTVVAVEEKREVPPIDATALDPVPESTLDSKHPWNIRISGVGGTGVMTASAVIATAAHLDGLAVRGTDMTGLAQKGGSVVSDLRISRSIGQHTGTVPRGGADLLIALDGVTGAEDASTSVLNAARTVAVLSNSATPTGQMCTDVKATRPDGVQVTGALGHAAKRAIITDAIRVSTKLFGESTFQIMLLIGAAVQAGALPVTPESMEKALRINGKKAEANIQAFRRGRQLVSRPEALIELMGVEPDYSQYQEVQPLDRTRSKIEEVLEPSLVDEVAVYFDEMRRWGSEQDAQDYLTDVRAVHAHERRVNPDGPAELTRAFAAGLHKLSAYKDEYEVARLALDPGFAEAQKGGKVTVQFQPPLLRALGLNRKIGLGPRMRPVLSALAKAKGLRGTRLDIFGYAEVRKLERKLVNAYREEILSRARNLHAPEQVAELASLAAAADGVRGFEDKKIDSAQELLQKLGRAGVKK